MFCEKCGESINAGQRFCTRCGAELVNPIYQSTASAVEEQPTSEPAPVIETQPTSEPAPVTETQPTSEPAPVIETQPTAAPEPANPLYLQTNPPEPAKKSKAWVGILIGVGILVLLIIAGISLLISESINKYGDSVKKAVTHTENKVNRLPEDKTADDDDIFPRENASTENSAKKKNELTQEVLDLYKDLGIDVEGEVKKNESSAPATVSDEALWTKEKIITDYNAVAWGVEYALSEDMPGILISVAPIINETENRLVVGITNLYDATYSISAEGKALNEAGEEIGMTYMYSAAVGPGCTTIGVIYCTDVPTGVIRWSDFEVKEAMFRSGGWEADWQYKWADDSHNSVKVDIDMVNTSTEKEEFGIIWIMLLDDSGNIIDMSCNYADEFGPDEHYINSMEIYGTESELSKAKKIAMFGNPYILN